MTVTLEDAQSLISSPVGTATAIGVAAGALLGGAAVVGVNAITSSGTKKRKKRKKKKSTSHRRKHHKKRKRHTPHTAGKGRDRSRKRIRYTKNGQPYVIMASGKARFISLRSAKLSHRRKGGRY